VDVLVNNAGIEGPNHKQIANASTIEELQREFLKDWDLWNPTWQTNTAAIIGVSGAFLHLLDEGNKRRGWVNGKREVQQRVSGDQNDQRTSQIITVASISAFNRYITAGLAYTASKAGAIMLGKSLANLLAPFGIRSNMIAPGRKANGRDCSILCNSLTNPRVSFRYDTRIADDISSQPDSSRQAWRVW